MLLPVFNNFKMGVLNINISLYKLMKFMTQNMFV